MKNVIAIYKSIRLLLLVTVLLSVTIKSPSVMAKVKQKALIVSSYHKDLEVMREMVGVLELRLKEKFKTHTVFMDTKRIERSKFNEAANRIKREVKSYRPDIIFLCDDNSLMLLGEYFLDEGFKVVFLGINNNPRKYIDINNFAKVSGVLERPLYLRGLIELKKIFFSNEESVTIIMDKSITSGIIKEELFHGKLRKKISRLNLNYKEIDSIQELKKLILLGNNDSKNQIVLGSLHSLIDSDNGRVVDFNVSVKMAYELYQKPLYSFWKDAIGIELCLAAYGVDMGEQGALAAKLGEALIFKKGFKHSIKTPSKGVLFLNRKQIKKLGIKLSNKFKARALFVE